jgi:hypothetical protein
VKRSGSGREHRGNAPSQNVSFHFPVVTQPTMTAVARGASADYCMWWYSTNVTHPTGFSWWPRHAAPSNHAGGAQDTVGGARLPPRSGSEGRSSSFRRRSIHVDDEAGPGKALGAVTLAAEWVVVLTEA